VRWRWAVPLVIGLAAAATHGWWLPWIGQSLVCAGQVTPSEALLVENFDPDYRLFERAATLQRGGVSARVLVPTPTAAIDSDEANPVDRGIVELMARFARVRNLEAKSSRTASMRPIRSGTS
jgi:hypothetical protein